MLQIKPCPFCGSAAKIITRDSVDRYHDPITFDVGCTNNLCYLSKGAEYCFENTEEIVILWNTRHKEKQDDSG